ncbi:MAG: hypothetical protein LBI17_02765 [Rickettsiales bacterium]|jgi:uncharacterized membrane-anchored protein|nr:hypothetical protein [Rickettsiales bacterium]
MFVKTLKLFILALAVSALAVWVSNNGGSASVEWLGYRVSTSAAFAIVFAASAFWLLARISRICGFLLHPFGGKKRKVKDEDPPV